MIGRHLIHRGILCRQHVIQTAAFKFGHGACISPSLNRNKQPIALGPSSVHIRRLSSLAESFTPRRAMMYVPGDSVKKIQKIPSLNADCVVLDCEDGVALKRKVQARTIISEQLDQISFGRTEACVRVNSIQSGFTEEDLKVTLRAKKLPSTIMLPKVESTSDLDSFEECLTNACKENNIKSGFKLVIFMESAIGLLNLHSVCEHAAQRLKSGTCPYTLDGIVFGSDDFLANIGATRTKDAMEIIMARQSVVVVAKAYGLQAIDIVHIDFKDLDDLQRQSLEGACMGFTGKQCIHPSQVPVIQQSFTPTSAKIEWAVELIKAFDSHQLSGEGAFTFRGSMIDMPSLRQAQNIVQLQALLNR